MNWEEKAWGRVMHLFVSSQLAVSLLQVKAGFRCSVHYHVHRANQFTVTEGTIIVEEYERSNGCDATVQRELKRGDTYTVKAGVWHCFRVLESGTVVENYWSDNGGEVSIDDIIRSDIGGKDTWPKSLSPWSVE